LWVGIKAPLALLEEREKQRGNRIQGSARAQLFQVHNKVAYDLEFDVSQQSLDEIAKAIQSQLADRCSKQ
jgi:chloramphenicol 3-O phosphotransferase